MLGEAAESHVKMLRSVRDTCLRTGLPVLDVIPDCDAIVVTPL